MNGDKIDSSLPCIQPKFHKNCEHPEFKDRTISQVEACNLCFLWHIWEEEHKQSELMARSINVR